MRLLLFAISLLVFVSAVEAQSPLEELERRLESQTPAPHTPGYLGLTADDRNTANRGLLVTAVQAGSPAAAAGLRTGDLLLEIERRPLRTTNDMSAVLATRAAGESIAVTFERGQQRHIVTVRLVPRPAASPLEPELPLPNAAESPPPEAVAPLPMPDPISAAEEIESLRRESAALRARLEQLERRLDQLQARLPRP